MSDKPVETPAAEVKPTDSVEAPAAEAAVEAPATETPAPAPAAEVANPAETATAAAPAAPVAAAAAAAADEKPTEDKPAEDKPAEDKPAEDKPAVPEKPAEAAAAAAAAEDKPAVPEKPAASASAPTPIQTLYAAQQQHGHPEIWGVTLADPATHVPSQVVFQKYLNANDGDLPKAKDQLLKTLTWRAATKPLELLKQAYNRDKFAGLGYVTSYHKDGTDGPEAKEVFTWNVYGNTKSIDKTFGDLKEFLHWRVALMELALLDLDLASATKPITADYDPYKIYQVHDYKSISFLRQSASVKAASTETIKVFAQNYPELLKEKFFVNVPAIMGFVYAFMKLFVAAKTIKKFHPMSNGGGLAAEFGASAIPDLGQRLPKEYGGKAGELKSLGKETKLEAAAAEQPVKEAPKEALKEAPKEATKEDAKEAPKEETPAAAAVAEPAKPTEEAAPAKVEEATPAAAPVEAAGEPAAEPVVEAAAETKA